MENHLFLQSSAKPHENAVRPLQRAAHYLKKMPILLIPVAAIIISEYIRTPINHSTTDNECTHHPTLAAFYQLA